VTEQPLEGGIANAGRVVRVGQHVLRPPGPHTGSIHAFLRAVTEAGFDGASFPVGIDADGRERLVLVGGEVPLVPYPEWSRSDTALAADARCCVPIDDEIDQVRAGRRPDDRSARLRLVADAYEAL
jgi:hypothetical protein